VRVMVAPRLGPGLAAEIVYRLNSELALSPLLAEFNADDYLK